MFAMSGVFHTKCNICKAIVVKHTTLYGFNSLVGIITLFITVIFQRFVETFSTTAYI